MLDGRAIFDTGHPKWPPKCIHQGHICIHQGAVLQQHGQQQGPGKRDSQFCDQTWQVETFTRF